MMLLRPGVSCNMEYPTMDEVEKGNRYQLGVWFRFLPSPGSAWAGGDNFKEMFKRETTIMQRLIGRFQDLGGMDMILSKQIGWTE